MAFLITWKHWGCSEPVTHVSRCFSIADAIREHRSRDVPLNEGDKILHAIQIGEQEAKSIAKQLGLADTEGYEWVTVEKVTMSELEKLLRLQVLNRRNCDEEAKEKLMSEAADEIAKLKEALRALHEADDAYGCGFYNDGAWRAAYQLTRELCGMKPRSL